MSEGGVVTARALGRVTRVLWIVAVVCVVAYVLVVMRGNMLFEAGGGNGVYQATLLEEGLLWAGPCLVVAACISFGAQRLVARRSQIGRSSGG